MTKKIFSLILLMFLILFSSVNQGYSLEGKQNNNFGSLNNFLKYKMLFYETQIKNYYRQVKELNTTNINNRRILVKLKNKNLSDLQKYGCYIEKQSDLLDSQNYVLISVPKTKNFQSVLNKLQSDPNVEFAEPDYILKIQKIPNDTYYSLQWYLSKINMPKVWNSLNEYKQTTVAVIDTGVDYKHEDLQGKLLPGLDLVYGRNLPEDDNGHGTHVAGIIAAVSDNAAGIASITNMTRILPIKAGDIDGNFTVSRVVEAILYAVSQKVDVINLSFAGYADSGIPILSIIDAIYEAYLNGIIVVAAAGNDSTNRLTYPAAIPPAIAVTACDENDEVAEFSNYGPWVDISAPGVDILSCIPKNLDNDGKPDGYTFFSGTSMAAPIISAVAALIKSIHPDWTVENIEWVLEYSADRSHQNSLWNEYTGYGIVDVYGALTTILPDFTDKAGNTPENAMTIFSKQSVQEKIDKPGDDDFFIFDVQETSKVNINISDVPSNLDLVVVIKKMDSEQTNADEYVINKNGLGKEETGDFTLSPGKYYIWVYDLYNHWSNMPYKIKLNINPSASNTLQKKLEVKITNEMMFDIKLSENVRIRSVELIDGGQVIASSQNINGTVATVVYKGELTKTSYLLKVSSIDGRYGIIPINITQTMDITYIDDVTGTIQIEALVDGKLYRNGEYIKSISKGEKFTFSNIINGDLIQLIPNNAQNMIIPATKISGIKR